MSRCNVCKNWKYCDACCHGANFNPSVGKVWKQKKKIEMLRKMLGEQK